VDAPYVRPDIFVKPGKTPGSFTVDFDRRGLPELSVAPEFRTSEAGRFGADLVKRATSVMEAVAARQETLVKMARYLVEAQKAFFVKGPAFLQPLRMIEAAAALQVHQTTVSRIARGKYVQCEWGVFEVRHFFSVNADVKQALATVLAEQKEANPGKKVTDQRLAELLAERGFTVARRTVTKYRGALQTN
jgi:RNA polymerase sigma-54 factor